MSGSDPWAEFRVADPPAADPWAEFRAPAPAAPAEQPRSIGRRALDAFTGAAQGLREVTRRAQGAQLLGFRDEAQGLAEAALGGSYGDTVNRERAQTRAFQERNPALATGLDVVGGFASPAPAIPFTRAGTFAGNMLRGGVTGAATGAVAGFGEGEGGLGNRAASAGTGALVGGTVGAALPPLLQGAAAAGARVGQGLGLTNPDTTANRIILRDLGRANVDPNEVLRRAQATGKPEMLADLGGENLLQTAQVVARTPGAGRDVAAANLAGRTGAAQGERLTGDVQRSVSGLDFRQEVGALLDQRSQEARPLYERAWQIRVPGTVTRALEPLTSGRIGQEAIGRGLRVMEEEGRAAYLASVNAGRPNPSLLFDPETVGAVRGQDGNWTLQGRMENLRLLDAVKRGLDEIAQEARDNVTGRPTQFGLMIERQRGELVNLLRDRFPAYRDALDAWAGPSALMDSMRLGRRLLTDGPDAADRTAQEIAKLSPSEREFFRAGVARGLLDRIQGTVDGAEQTRLNRIFMSEGVRSRLRAAFDSDAEFNDFAQNMMREANIARTNRTIAPNGGSPTMPMQERAADLRSPPSGPLVSSLIDPERAPAVNLSEEVLQRGGGVGSTPLVMWQRFKRGISENDYRRNTEALAPRLFTTDPTERARYAQQLVEQAVAEEQRRRALAPVVQGLLGGAPAAAGLLAN